MKNIFVFIGLLIFISCQKESMVDDLNPKLENLTIESLTSLLPLSESESKTKAIFYNKEGDEIIFDFTIEKMEEEKFFKSSRYKSEEYAAFYKNKWVTDYYLCFTGFGNYSMIGEPATIGITALIHQRVEPMSTQLTFDDSGRPIVAMFYERKQLLDREFVNVYSNYTASEFTAFSELYYNPTYGIIGFRDRQDELYVFREFAE